MLISTTDFAQEGEVAEKEDDDEEAGTEAVGECLLLSSAVV